MKRVILPVMLTLGVIGGGAGCSRPPTEELMQAEAALQAAQAEGAEDYAPNDFKAAAEALADAKSKTESRDYDAARTSAVEAKQKADIAKASVGPERMKMRGEIETTLVIVTDEWSVLMDDARKKRLDPQARGTMDAAVIAFDSLATDIRENVEEEDYIGAMKSLKEARTKITEVNGLLEGK